MSNEKCYRLMMCLENCMQELTIDREKQNKTKLEAKCLR